VADYCVSDDVIRELPEVTIDSTTKPSKTEVDQFCSDVTAEMDARLRAVGISVPVTDADLLKVVKPIAVNGAKAKVLRAKEEEDERAATFEELYQSALGRIEARPSILRETESPGQPEGTARDDDDIRFTRTGDEW
jgi:hypothetical protein